MTQKHTTNVSEMECLHVVTSHEASFNQTKNVPVNFYVQFIKTSQTFSKTIQIADTKKPCPLLFSKHYDSLIIY